MIVKEALNKSGVHIAQSVIKKPFMRRFLLAEILHFVQDDSG